MNNTSPTPFRTSSPLVLGQVSPRPRTPSLGRPPRPSAGTSAVKSSLTATTRWPLVGLGGTDSDPEMLCLPVGGGFVDFSPLAFVAKARVWGTNSTFAFAANDKYNAIVWSQATLGVLKEITATPFQLGK